MKKNIKRWTILFILVLTLFLGIIYYWNNLLAPVNPSNTEEVSFLVYKGESTTDISDRLQKEKLIKSAWAFNLIAKQTSQASSIQTGEFKLSPAQSSREILKQLTSGMIQKWVTLIEGWRIEEMAEKLNKELGISQEDFIEQADEGYMFPDTYLFDPKVSTQMVVSKLRTNFYQKYTTELQTKIREVGLAPDQGVILASIVEREARSDEARQMVASILLKRLKIDMGLNTDATIQYAVASLSKQKPPPDGWWKRKLTHEDLAIKSILNTYIHAGLPPTPICNPSLSSLKAVAAATPTDYLYYYHDSNGIPHYAKTLEEHNNNIANYP